MTLDATTDSTPDSTDSTVDSSTAATDEALRFALQGEDLEGDAQRMTTAGMARRLPRLLREALALAWRVDRRAAVALLACQLVSAITGALGLLATNQTITALVASGHITARLRQAVPAICVLAGAAGLRALFGIAITALSNRLSPMVTREAQFMMLDAATNAELSAYDHPGFNDRWDLADRGAATASDMIGLSQNLISSAASLVSAAVVLAIIHPLLLPLTLLAAIPQAVAATRAARVAYEAMIATSGLRRVMGMLRWHLGDKWQADQIRSDTIAPYLLGKYSAAAEEVERQTNRAVWRGARISLVGSVAAGLTSGAVWVTLALLLSAGLISIGSAGTAVFALRAASQGLQGMVGYGAQLFRSGLYLDHWSTFVAEASGMRLARGHGVPEAPAVVAARKVSFTYPTAEKETLHEVDLEIRRGEIVALIGENGSGKSTLMRLLCGLNLPTAGAVEWDGVDTRELDPHALWRHVAVVPQEFARWPMSARENIHLGQPRPDGDTSVLRAAAASGADDVIASLRSGLDTLLAREFWGGVALSSGQWQRFAVARSLHRGGGLLVLDEPTSDLDPRAEHRIFTGLREIAADRAVILVTHNLANASVADRIVCMEGGRITQSGSFAELVNQPGIFQRLWSLQSDRPIPEQRHQDQKD
ncbi:ATP-binding cassette, subfamily B [Streptacidiphilus jiangxiensis]|uniref:ATP-binding cassette, subfamily B n=1 Tax=Streptacidiphilus jiangxiensis TaxID=235985 RepID=A0A1H7TRA8_STRJI|nr:ATP-binding cassette, subfamily B [Streptacidiphilus jiangxiensis]